MQQPMGKGQKGDQQRARRKESWILMVKPLKHSVHNCFIMNKVRLGFPSTHECIIMLIDLLYLGAKSSVKTPAKRTPSTKEQRGEKDEEHEEQLPSPEASPVANEEQEETGSSQQTKRKRKDVPTEENSGEEENSEDEFQE